MPRDLNNALSYICFHTRFFQNIWWLPCLENIKKQLVTNEQYFFEKWYTRLDITNYEMNTSKLERDLSWDTCRIWQYGDYITNGHVTHFPKWLSDCSCKNRNEKYADIIIHATSHIYQLPGGFHFDIHLLVVIYK